MAYELTGMDDRSIFRTAVKSYDCTSVDDIANLPRFNIPGKQKLNDGHDDINNAPCGYGSTALVKGGDVYRLFPDHEWAPI